MASRLREALFWERLFSKIFFYKAQDGSRIEIIFLIKRVYFFGHFCFKFYNKLKTASLNCLLSFQNFDHNFKVDKQHGLSKIEVGIGADNLLQLPD